MADGGGFDLERGKITMPPRMLWSLVAFAIALGGGIYAVHYRLGGVELAITDVKQEIAAVREDTQTKQQAYIDCLEAERSNRRWVCPMAKSPPAKLEPARPAAKLAKRKGETSTAGWSWPWAVPAQAKGK
jgi:hypothetical protein